MPEAKTIVGNVIIRYYIKPPLATARAASRDGSICLSVCLSPKCKNAIFSKTKQFNNYGLHCRPIGSRTRAFQITRYWTPKIQNGGDLPS